MKINRWYQIIKEDFIHTHAESIVKLRYGNIWNLRKLLKSQTVMDESLLFLYNSYFRSLGSWIGIGAEFADKPTFPHGYHGIFISHNAKIGKGVTIFHQVTIGSNMTVGSKRQGSPSIGDNVYIGAGAKVIGNVTVGRNVRIGANCVVVKDVPENSVTVLGETRTIIKKIKLDNTWIRVTANPNNDKIE